MSDELRAMLIRQEGLKLRLYKDTSVPPKWTIGVGHNIEDEGITEAMAYFIFDDDIAKHTADAQQLPMFHMLDPVRQDVIVSMVFNMGLPRVRGFVKMLSALADGNWQEAAVQMAESRWASQVGNRARELASMIRTGEYP